MTHKWYCPNCTVYLYGDTTFDLAVQVNQHNMMKHPFEKSDWTRETIRNSAHFETADSAPDYVKKPDSLSVAAQPVPVTLNMPEDIEFLKKARIKW